MTLKPVELMMSVKKFLSMTLIVLLLLSLTACNHQMGILNPKGIIASEERKLFFDALALMLIVVIPVIIMSLVFVYHYQVSHRVKDYKPNWSHNLYLEIIWWTIPCIIILVLAIITWKKSHELDPFQPIPAYKEPPMLIQVIALPWKWLFIYPKQNIATVNYLEIPVNQQVEYWFTTDNVPMSSFFVPQLGSQIYTMTGMRTRLHLVAKNIGVYEGMNTQYNGNGFAGMRFQAHVVDPAEMQRWVTKVKASSNHLTNQTYHQLLNPSFSEPPKFFAGTPDDLFNHVFMLYMMNTGPNHPRENTNKFHQE